MWLDSARHAAEHISTTKAAMTGGGGAAVAVTAAVVEPSTVELWLRMATLGVGLLTGLGSGGLVLLKYWDRWRGPKQP
jgi:hypothetical protein